MICRFYKNKAFYKVLFDFCMILALLSQPHEKYPWFSNIRVWLKFSNVSVGCGLTTIRILKGPKNVLYSAGFTKNKLFSPGDHILALTHSHSHYQSFRPQRRLERKTKKSIY
jgi:hypothetical protein